MNLVIALAILNLPVYWIFGWALFVDSREEPMSFWGITWKIFCEMNGPPSDPWTDAPTETGGQLLTKVLFYTACAAMVGGEYYLLTTYVWPAQ
ncbi:hypothetical protein [Blastopirellula retiformator]|uniref:Uncharacterized protein n=1 Tax=Blastopirellula retiformator TaxID=2527970 RepID=A0A5C5VMV3_9BACT|nr:hypothetical protein [Blastopirellula retiformator]TWT39340.1 hypothetical protein Enr8_10390 [Blastopirellula retiformator]